jgi:hypothetical protein
VNRIRWTALALLIATSTAFCGGQEPKTLRWKFQPEQKLRFAIDQQLDQSAIVSGAPVKTKIELGLELTWLVESLDASGTATIVQSIERVRASMQTPDAAEAAYDSAETKRTTAFARSVHEAVSPYLGVKVRQTVNGRGEVLAASAAEPPAGEEGAASKSSLLPKENLERILSQAAIVFPEQPVNKGDAWKRNLTIGGPTGGAVEITYTYAGVEQHEGRSIDRIDAQTRFTAPPKEKDRPALKIVEQQSSGVIRFDAEAGRVVSSEMKSGATIETTLAAETVVSKLATTTRLTVTPVE